MLKIKLSIGVFRVQVFSVRYNIFLSKTFNTLLFYFIFYLINKRVSIYSEFVILFLNIRYIIKLLNRIAERSIVILVSRLTEWQPGYLIISYSTRSIFLVYTPAIDYRLLIPSGREQSFGFSRIVKYLGLESTDQCCQQYGKILRRTDRSLTVCNSIFSLH